VMGVLGGLGFWATFESAIVRVGIRVRHRAGGIGFGATNSSTFRVEPEGPPSSHKEKPRRVAAGVGP